MTPPPQGFLNISFILKFHSVALYEAKNSICSNLDKSWQVSQFMDVEHDKNINFSSKSFLGQVIFCKAVCQKIISVISGSTQVKSEGY